MWKRFRGAGSFCIADRGTSASLYVDPDDHVGVVRATGDLESDITRVTDIHPAIARDPSGLGPRPIIIGTIGKSALIDRLIRTGKIKAASIAGKWESFLIQVVPKPLPGVASALVIAGSDKRGTITASTTSPSKSESHPGIGGPMFPCSTGARSM